MGDFRLESSRCDGRDRFEFPPASPEFPRAALYYTFPITVASVDFVWRRDMLVHIRDLASAIGECYRILHGGGKMLAWVTVETRLMEPREAERLYAPLGIEPASVSQKFVGGSF